MRYFTSAPGRNSPLRSVKKPLSYKITIGYHGRIERAPASVPASLLQSGGYYYTEGE
jgi:hypothetical protein